ncbi:hypothetical protein C8Q80DRAFT_1267893 [Daedaleopsis nitida]|nr:hypothetical protein C8Q80DRAFT_1267893 [Daedaleopsis nitida]
MSGDSNCRHEDWEPSEPSQSARFSIPDILAVWLAFCEAHNTANPEHPIERPCARCFRWLLYGEGHMHVTSHASDPDDSDLWDNVSPHSTFLSDYLPPVLGPDPSASSASSVSTTSDAVSIPAVVPSGHVKHSGTVNVDPEHEHEFCCRNCGGRVPPERVNFNPASRSIPLSSELNLTGLASSASYDLTVRRAGTSATEGSVDINTIDSADTSLSSLTASSGHDSLYTTPEHVNVALPGNDDLTMTVTATPVDIHHDLAGIVDPANLVNPTAAVATAAAVATTAPVVTAAGNTAASNIPPPVVPAANVIPAAHVVPAATVNIPSSNTLLPYVAYLAPPSEDAEGWYVVTRGRIIGIFDNSAQMQYSVGNVPNGSGRRYATRDLAIHAFLRAEADGIVKEVYPPPR